jgi:rhodanese-related sulfurtransferase
MAEITELVTINEKKERFLVDVRSPDEFAEVM